MSDYPYPCHHCRKELGKEGWVEVQTPITPVRVHKGCEKEYLNIQNTILIAMFGR